MARPWKHPDSGIYYVRERIPRDVLAAARGQHVKFPKEAGEGSIRLPDNATHAKASLRTRDPHETKVRHAAALAHLEKFWQSLRDGLRRLSHKQIIALAGDFRQRAIAKFDEEPGPAVIWVRLLELSERWDDDARRRETAPFVEEHLARHALNVDAYTKAALADEMFKVGRGIAALMKRRAEGDYGPDDKAGNFPPLHLATDSPSADVSIRGLFKGWEREARAGNYAEKTFDEYRAVVERLVKFLNHDDAARVSPKDIVAYKDMRLGTINPRTKASLSPKTVNDGDLAALRSIFGWAVTNHRLSNNPAKGITVKLAKPVRLRGKGYTDEEAVKLLSAALAYRRRGKELEKTAAAKRWAPWLCAFSGARIGEVLQLRRGDVQRSGSHWTMVITPEAGPVKSKKRRVVPLHPQLIELGFIAFVEAAKEGYLFLTAAKKTEVRGRLNGVKNRVSEFVRSIVAGERIQPNHAWRHRLITLARKHGLDQELRRMITGHAGEGVDETDYGEPEGLYREICKLPHYPIADEAA
jgi:integrase